MSARNRGFGIPRLQELDFLEHAILGAAEGLTFDEIRRRLFDVMEFRRSQEVLTGNHAGARQRSVADERYGYLHNASEALGELMRLGYVERQALPSSRKSLEGHRSNTYVVTDQGERWVARLAEKGPARLGAYNELISRLWRAHPKFAGLLRLLAASRFVVPTAGWPEANPTDVLREEGDIHRARERYVAFLAERCERAFESGNTGWFAERLQIVDAIDAYIADRLASARRRGRADPYKRSRDFTNACEEALVSFAFRRAGVPLDYISLEILRRWSRTLGLAGFSYHVPLRPALILWSTADLIAKPSGEPEFRRRTSEEYLERVIEELPAAFDRARRAEGSGFVSIYRVRAACCSELQVSDAVFDRAFREFIAGRRGADRAYRINLDPAQYGTVPPTERPLVMPDGRGRSRHYFVMSLVNQQTAKEPT